jgi:DNA polymerase III subunit epsilon
LENGGQDMSKLLFYDGEMTGLVAGTHQIHQLAFTLEIDGAEVARENLKMRPDPGTPVSPQALETCKLTIEDLKAHELSQREGYLRFIQILGQHINKFDKSDKAYLVAYNERFDNGFLRAWFAANNDDYFGSWFYADTHCVMVLASFDISKRVTDAGTPARSTLPNFKLQTIAAYYGIEPEGGWHDGMVDLLATREIYKRFE